MEMQGRRRLRQNIETCDGNIIVLNMGGDFIFTVTRDQERFILYTLRDTDTDSSVVVCPERGGSVISFKVHNREVLWLDSAIFEDPTQNVQGGIPVLFPICSVLSENGYHVDETTYHLPLHGYARSVAWRFVKSSTNDEEASITLVSCSNALTKALYPYDYEFQLTYCLRESVLLTKIEILNQSDRKMPVHYGFHPFLHVSTKDDSLILSTNATEYYDLGDDQTHPFTGKIDLREDHHAKLFFDVESFSVTDPQDQCKISVWGSKEFSTYVLWSGDGKRYCIEPWTAGIDALNTGLDLINIDENRRHSSWFAIGVQQQRGAE